MKFVTFGGDVGKGAGGGGELLVGGMEAFWAVEDKHRRGRKTHLRTMLWWWR